MEEDVEKRFETIEDDVDKVLVENRELDLRVTKLEDDKNE